MIRVFVSGHSVMTYNNAVFSPVLNRRIRHDGKMSFVIDSMKVLRNHVTMHRTYFPLVLTSCVITLFVTVFLSRVRQPASMLMLEAERVAVDGVITSRDKRSYQHANDSLNDYTKNSMGYMSYSDFTQNGYLTSTGTCEYGSIWQTLQQLQVQVVARPELSLRN